MTELDELERDLLQAADTWFNQTLHRKLQRLVSLARAAELFAYTATPPANFGIKSGLAIRSSLAQDESDAAELRDAHCTTFDRPV